MSISSEIQRISGKVSDSFDAVVVKGGTVTSRKIADLPIAIGTISGGGEPETRYGKTIANFFGDVDANGVMQESDPIGDIVFTGVKDIAANGLAYKFAINQNIRNVSFPDLVEITGNSALRQAFSSSYLAALNLDNVRKINGDYVFSDCCSGCISISTISFSSLTSVFGNYTFYYAFSSNSITTAILESLVSVVGESAFNSCFVSAYYLENVYIGSLTSIRGNCAFEYFVDSNSLQNIDFSSLTSIFGYYAVDCLVQYSPQITSFYLPMLQYSDSDAWTEQVFYENPSLTELHFRKDMADIVPNWNGYSSNFGASNATIYFDLVGKITVGGATYMRSEQDSIRSNHIKQYVAWTKKTIAIGGLGYLRDSAKDNVTSSGLMLWAWTNGNTTYYTTDRLPTTSSDVYNASGTRQTSLSISEVSTDDTVYTAFDDTTKAEPDVGTVVYSDAGQTSIGTVEAIA